MTLHTKIGASPTPWTFRESAYRGGPNWIEDANGEQVVEGISAADGARIVADVNAPDTAWLPVILVAWVTVVAAAATAFLVSLP